MNSPNLILYNGRIYTMDAKHPIVQAIAIRDDKIVAVGSDALLSELGRHGTALNLQGQTVIPGLIDAHLHFVWYSLGLQNVDLHDVTSLEQALTRIAQRVAQSPAGAWIRGGRWDCNVWGGAFPTRQDLDRVAPQHPVFLLSKDGHSAWVNSRALELAGVDAQTPDRPGGRILRDAQGVPTGILQEKAIRLVQAVIPPPSLEEMVAACRKGLVHAHRVGLTGIHNCEGARELAALQQLAQQNELTLRVLQHIPYENLDAAIQLGLRDGLGDTTLRLHGIKAFADGALGSRSAWMLAPYETDPDNRGVPTLTPQETNELVRRANQAGLSVAIHAIGDAANRMVLDAFERYGNRRLRNRIEHVQLLHPDDLGRLVQLHVTASMQPIHATSDIDIAERHWGARSATAYAWQSLLQAGTILVFGSDAPVESISPLEGLYAAVTRRRADGYPGEEGWYPEQRIDLTKALRAYTLNAAWVSGEAQIKGSLTPGKLADLVVLDRDIFHGPPTDLLNAQVMKTMVGGRWVYWAETA